MKKTLVPLSLLSFVLLMLFSSCATDDPADETNSISLFLSSGSNLVNGDATLDVDQDIVVELNANQGDSELNALSIYEDGSLISLDRLLIDGVPASANAIALFDADRVGFTKEIKISSLGSLSTSYYSFVVTDDELNTEEVGFNIVRQAEPPSISITSLNSISVSPDSWVSIPISVTAGSASLYTLTVYQKGELISEVERLAYDDLSATFTSNPSALPDEDVNGFDIDLFIKSQVEANVQVYKIVIEDELGLQSETEYTIITGTPLTTELMGAVFNANGQNGGGLNLDNGETVSVNSSDAHIVDEGIDQSLPDAQNWRQQIKVADILDDMVYIIPGMNGVPENFSFADIAYKEEIQSLYFAGEAFTATNDDGYKVSDEVQVGDIFAIYIVINPSPLEAEFAIVEVTQVNVTEDDNFDNYVFNIKK